MRLAGQYRNAFHLLDIERCGDNSRTSLGAKEQPSASHRSRRFLHRSLRGSKGPRWAECDPFPAPSQAARIWHGGMAVWLPPLVFRRHSSGVVATSGRHSHSAPSIIRNTLSLPDSHARVYIVDRRYTWGIHERSSLGLDFVQPMERALLTRAVSSSITEGRLDKHCKWASTAARTTQQPSYVRMYVVSKARNDIAPRTPL